MSCIQRSGAVGILEINIINRMANIFGSLKKDNNFIVFIECFSQTNYFKLLYVKKEQLYNVPRGVPRDYLYFLNYVLNIHAKNKNKFFGCKNQIRQDYYNFKKVSRG